MQCSQSQLGCSFDLNRHFLCWPAWHCTQILSKFSTLVYFFDWSKPNPPSCGPTMNVCRIRSILDYLNTIPECNSILYFLSFFARNRIVPCTVNVCFFIDSYRIVTCHSFPWTHGGGFSFVKILTFYWIWRKVMISVTLWNHKTWWIKRIASFFWLRFKQNCSSVIHKRKR